MITQKKTFSIQELSPFTQHFMRPDMLLLDIETTGLSADRQFIYCIGCSFLCGSDITIQLFFAEDQAQEKEILQELNLLLSSYKTVITFNGTTFDLPFLRKRCALYSIQDPFAATQSVDLYREARRLKNFLMLSDYKQKSIETFLGCQREDTYSGKELIVQYLSYQKQPQEALLHNLLLHNFEDVRGMYHLLDIMNYINFFQGDFQIENIFLQSVNQKRFCNIQLQSQFPFPQKLTFVSEENSFILNDSNALLSFPVYHGLLRHYFCDYKNYYYLPEEHTIIHKSLGSCVDSSHRQKATRENCFLEKECDYLMHSAPDRNAYLKKDLTDTSSYFELPGQCISNDNSLTLPASMQQSFYLFLSSYFEYFLT